MQRADIKTGMLLIVCTLQMRLSGDLQRWMLRPHNMAKLWGTVTLGRRCTEFCCLLLMQEAAGGA